VTTKEREIGFAPDQCSSYDLMVDAIVVGHITMHVSSRLQYPWGNEHASHRRFATNR
jgi:hypothetical protein